MLHLPDKAMRHYLYFPQKPDAEAAGQRLREWGFSVDVLKGADGENWLALARRVPPGDERGNGKASERTGSSGGGIQRKL